MSTSPAAPVKSGVVVPNQPSPSQRFIAFFVWLLVKAIGLSLRYRWVDRTGYKESGMKGPAIYALWHNRLALCLVKYFWHVKHRGRPDQLAALVSASKDGGLLSGIFDRFGVLAVRGSSSRRGPQALRELTSRAREGYDIGITPDGPRGPKCIVQDGVIAIAQLTGFPIVPMSYRAKWRIQMKSWDQFQIPLPLSRCEVIFDAPIHVPRELTPELREQLRLQLQNALNAISAE